MLSSNVLCMKKRKKRSYCVSNVSDYGGKYRDKRGTSGVTMMHITEDTPPDMLAGAMDLTVHLPNGRPVKMSVERSTPMMDVLVQITTAHQLQLSGHIIHALGMAPSAEHNDKILPYKPNTPIGTLDTQHIRVLPKGRSLPPQKSVPSGHQPFESTFRLKVHLPRNQLYVSRVSRNIHLADIMKNVCEEKNLDPTKYEFRHPGNLDEVLDPKLTLSDYQITEIYVVSRGSSRLSQAFSASDIMALRKDDDRKQSKSSGGVFNLIFKRGKTSNGSGSLSSDNRSISPTHSDDSRSVTPPAIPQKIIKEVEKPKAPLRKRRPAPKPPQPKEEPKLEPPKKTEITICHSRNSSDSSGYHEASILSDNANTSLPRRPQSLMRDGEHSRSSSNLTTMSSQSKSTSSLAFTGRKKKPPPPPPALKSSTSSINLEKASPVVASPLEKKDLPTAHCMDSTNQIHDVPPKPRPRSFARVSKADQNHDPINDAIDNTEPVTDTNKQDIKVVENTNEILIEEVNEEKNYMNRKSLEEKSFDNYTKALENIHVDLFNEQYKKPTIPSTQEENRTPKTSIFGIGKSLRSMGSETSSLYSYAASSVDDDISDDMSDVNVDMFGGSIKKQEPIKASNMDELMGIHAFGKERSAASLHSVDSLPGFLTNSAIKKWKNVDELDEISMASGNWLVGDSDTESITTPQIIEETEKPESCTTNSPPESIASLATTLSSNIDVDLSKENSEIIENETKTESIPTFTPIEETIAVEPLDSDWQYQLPSPPTAFRDETPTATNIENLTNYESTDKFNNTDSVVTSPELFEKLKQVKETQSEISEVPSVVVSEEEKPIFNKLSLENLEKRKSLVYNRELATSFKYDESVKTDESTSSKRSSVINELEEIISNNSNTLTRRSSCTKSQETLIQNESSLPNFKITTYDMPKKKINIFEDDSVRSNETPNLVKMGEIGRSMENISYRKSSIDDVIFRKPQEFNKYRSKTLMRTSNDYTENKLGRSESFSNNNWVPMNPVKRSKSQVAINQYKDDTNIKENLETTNLSKSSSLFDVSGLQSLGVMRMIQTKLKTPTNSMDELDKAEEIIKEKPVTPKPYQYRGPPSINLGTWSDRPKQQVSLKEDTDYKIKQSDTERVSIKVNGSESISSQKSGNVIIKIGSSDNNKSKDDFSSRFINHTTAVGYRKPLGNINKVDTPQQRPHSVAFDNQYDISRVPVVRSMELKKPFKDMHLSTSITQICPDNETNYKETQSLNYINNNKSSQVWVSTDSVNKPVTRLNSFSRNAPVVKGFNTNTEPDKKIWNCYSTLPAKTNQSQFTTNNNVPFSQVILRRTDSNKTKQSGNNNSIFGNVVLRNTNNNRYSTGNILNNEKAAPPPPTMPKTIQTFPKLQKQKQVEASSPDQRDELLSAIRNFGGKKGLKAAKV